MTKVFWYAGLERRGQDFGLETAPMLRNVVSLRFFFASSHHSLSRTEPSTVGIVEVDTIKTQDRAERVGVAWMRWDLS